MYHRVQLMFMFRSQNLAFRRAFANFASAGIEIGPTHTADSWDGIGGASGRVQGRLSKLRHIERGPDLGHQFSSAKLSTFC